MRYMTVKEASEKWNISTRRVCILCKNGRVGGAIKKSKVWMIPANAKKPEDARITDTGYGRNPLRLFLNPEFDKQDDGNTVLTSKEKFVCEIQRKFFSGQLEEAYFGVSVLLGGETDERFILFLKFLKMYFAADLGRREDYLDMLDEIRLLNKKLQDEHMGYVLLDYYIGEVDEFDAEVVNGEAFEELMPLVSILSIKRGLNEMIRNGGGGSVLHFEIICKELESKDCPLISAYFHIFLAVYLNALGNENSYRYHIERAVRILLPRGWYTPLAEYASTIDLSFIKSIDARAYWAIEELSKKIISNYVKTGLFDPLWIMPRLDWNINIQVAIKIVQGKNHEEIAREMGISLYKVRQHMNELYDMVGSRSKNDIIRFVFRNFIL